MRSVIVATGNLASNMLQLSTWGVSPVTMAVKGTQKWAELSTYVQNQEKSRKLQVRLGAKLNDKMAADRIGAQIQALEDANRKLSIAPLIEASEFTTVSEDLTEADVAIREGRWAEHLEELVKKGTSVLPQEVAQGLMTGLKNALPAKDTAFFQALNRMVSYGDFIAKAVLCDHLMERKVKKGEMGEEELLQVIRQEFVAYNRAPGRVRDALEGLGLAWFWSYKLRILGPLLRAMRERPLTALMAMGQMGPGLGIDSVASGSVLGGNLDPI